MAGGAASGTGTGIETAGIPSPTPQLAIATSRSIPAHSSSGFVPSSSPRLAIVQSHDGVAGPASPGSFSDVAVTEGEPTSDGVCIGGWRLVAVDVGDGVVEDDSIARVLRFGCELGCVEVDDDSGRNAVPINALAARSSNVGSIMASGIVEKVSLSCMDREKGPPSVVVAGVDAAGVGEPTAPPLALASFGSPGGNAVRISNQLSNKACDDESRSIPGSVVESVMLSEDDSGRCCWADRSDSTS